MPRTLPAAGALFAAATAMTLAVAPGNPVRITDGSNPSRLAVFELPREASAGSADHAALLIHGFQCNHSMMVPLARALVAEGVHVFLLDLPGHGASESVYSDAAAAEAAREAVELVIRRTRLPRERIALVGHSYGAMVLAPIAGAHPEHPSVFIGPGYRAGVSGEPRVSEEAPRTLTILTAAHDYDFVIDAARGLAGEGTRGSLEAPGTWRSSSGALREWSVIPEVAHVSLIFDARTHAATARAVRGHPASSSAADEPSSALRWLGVSMPLTALALAAAMAARCRAAAHAPRSVSRLRTMRLALVAAYAVLPAIFIARARPPMAMLSLMEGEGIASFIVVAGFLAVIGGRLAFRTWLVPSRAVAATALPCALVAFGLVYLAATVVVSPAAFHLIFDPLRSGRLLSACVMAVGFYPYFAVGEECAAVVASDTPEAPLRRVKAWACRLFLPLATTAALPLLSSRLERFTLAVLALGLFCAGFGALLSRVSRNPAVGAIFASAVSAWIVAVGFTRY